MNALARVGAPRLARAADAQAIHELLWSARDDIPLKATFNSPAHVEWARSHCRDGRFVVVDVDGAIAGTMLLNPKEVFYLVVAARHRRLGIARSLIAYAKSRNGELRAKTQEGNARTIALLQHEGFRSTMPLYADGWLHFSWTKHRR